MESPMGREPFILRTIDIAENRTLEFLINPSVQQSS